MTQARRQPAKKAAKHRNEWSRPAEGRLDRAQELFGNVPQYLLEDIIDECASLHGEDVRLRHAMKRIAEYEAQGGK